MRGDDFFRFVRHAIEQPFSVTFYVNRGIFNFLGFRHRGKQFCGATFDGDVGRDELDRSHVDFQL